MLQLTNLNIVNFKNLEQVDLKFKSKFNCFTGNNGAGKTNLLDAIYYLSISKSYFNSIDLSNIKHNETYFNLKANYIRNEEEEALFCAYVTGKKKKLKRNNKEYDKLSNHIGEFPVIMVTPYDNVLISGGSEERRKFLDIVISQFNKEYLVDLMLFNKTLKQRNAQLKHMFENEISDITLIDIYDKLLVESGNRIFNARKDFVVQLSKLFLELYESISKSNEHVAVTFQSNLENIDYAAKLKSNFRNDLISNRTSLGIHKDDLTLSIFNHPAKKIASQGQQKTFLLALKLAQYKILSQSKGIKPLLLLDDIFDRLDRNRISNLMDIISQNEFGQVFLTDTNIERIGSVFSSKTTNHSIFSISDGNIVNK